MKCCCSQHVEPLITWDDVTRRIAAANQLGRSLRQLYFSHLSSAAVWRCEVCGQHWGDVRPYAEQHGWGPSCFFPIEWNTRHEDMDRESSRVDLLRRNHEDSVFMDKATPLL
jgi:hypothetical protein